MFEHGVRNHVIACQAVAPLFIEQKRGLIVTTTYWDRGHYIKGNLFYDLAKNAVSHLVWAMAQELRDHNVAAVALAPGFMRTERIVEAFTRAGAAHALDGPGGPTETPFYLGRSIVALASDPRVIDKSGTLLEVGALAREYGFTDVDGTQPSPYRLTSPA
jgi:NAD(P)-dependent dehydrogenase (short-subunit alcohol dehydrogenase family)